MTINEELAEFDKGCKYCERKYEKDGKTPIFVDKGYWENPVKRLCPSCRNRKLGYIKGRLKGFEEGCNKDFKYYGEWETCGVDEIDDPNMIGYKITPLCPVCGQNIKILKEEQEKLKNGSTK